MTQRDAVEMLLARDEIRQLPYHYAAAIESHDIDAMADLFSPHARFARRTLTLRWVARSAK